MGRSRSALGVSVLLLGIALAVSMFSGCAPTSDGVASTVPASESARSLGLAGSRRFDHIVIMIQENRSFDNLFAGFPGADSTFTGTAANGSRIKLRKSPLLLKHDLGHGYDDYVAAWNTGSMNGFDQETNPPSNAAYQYVDPAKIEPYWDLASQYVLADHLFSTQGSASFTAHQDLIAAGTPVNDEESIIDIPTAYPWGCDAPKNTVTSLISRDNQYELNAGPFPCFTYRTLRDLLDEKHISWKSYAPPLIVPGSAWSAFAAIAAVRDGPEWKTNVITPETRIFQDISSHKLASMTWIVPDAYNSDHPGVSADYGPSWVGRVVDAIGDSSYWSSTAIIIVWDDWGGFYDHVSPPQMGFGGLGFRVPMIVVSPFSKNKHVSHVPYEFGSIVRFVEDNFGLGRLGRTDVRAADIDDAFDFTQPPRQFKDIHAPYPQAFFEHRKPSMLPPDTE